MTREPIPWVRPSEVPSAPWHAFEELAPDGSVVARCGAVVSGPFDSREKKRGRWPGSYTCRKCIAIGYIEVRRLVLP